MHEKRFRDQEKVIEENKKIAMRVIHQSSTIKNRSKENASTDKESPRRMHEKTFYESRIKERKLPKLLEMRS